MNDSAEVEYAHSVLHEILHGYDEVFPIPGASPLSTLVSDITELRLSLYRDCMVCAACFCEDGDLLSQWRGYAPNNGFSIGFSRLELGNRVGEPFPIVYDRQDQLDRVALNVGVLVDSFDWSNTEQAGSVNFTKITEWCYDIVEELDFFKSNAFREEKEWRVRCYLADEEDPERAHFRAAPSGLVPYMKLDIGRGINACIKEIVVGPTTRRQDAKRAVEILLTASGADHVSVRLSDIALRS
jgi:hypothetical protein